MKITREKLREWDACYTDEHIAEVVPAYGLDMLGILSLPISDKDRIWVATRPGALPRSIWMKWLARIVERSLGRIADPDPRSVAVVAALRADAVTLEICRLSAAAREYADADADADADAAAAWAAWAAAALATWAALAAAAFADAAWADAAAAAWAALAMAAAWASERENQISDLRNLLEQYEAKN